MKHQLNHLLALHETLADKSHPQAEALSEVIAARERVLRHPFEQLIMVVAKKERWTDDRLFVELLQFEAVSALDLELLTEEVREHIGAVESGDART